MSVTQSCPALCDLMDYSLPGSSVHGILHARIPEWKKKKKEYRSGFPCPPPGDLPHSGIEPKYPALQADYWKMVTFIISGELFSKVAVPFCILIVLVYWAAMTKYYRLGGLSNRNLLFHNSGGKSPSSRSRCWQGWFLPRPAFSMACRLSSPYHLTWSSLCVCSCPNLFL